MEGFKMKNNKNDVAVNNVVAPAETVAPASAEAVAPAVPTGDIKDKIISYGIDAATTDKIIDELGVETIDDFKVLEVDDLVNVGVKVVKARKMLADIKADVDTKAVANASATTTNVDASALMNQYASLLPSVPNDDSWLKALKAGGVLKVGEASYIAAIRAAFAYKAKLYDIPKELVKCIEAYSDETEEQVDATFYKMRNALTRRNYSDIFAAIEGLDGTFVTEKRRNDFLKRINDDVWPAIMDSYNALDGWYQTWKSSISDPSMFAAAFTGMFNGGHSAMMINAPDTAVLHDAGETLVNAINRAFRGTGVQIAAALAYDANEIRKTLEDPSLPAMIGVRNREMMLKKIGVNVSSNYVRLEQNLVKYVLGFVNHDTVTSDIEVNYFVALWQLGAQINWDELGRGNLGNGRNTLTSVTGKQMF